MFLDFVFIWAFLPVLDQRQRQWGLGVHFFPEGTGEEAVAKPPWKLPSTFLVSLCSQSFGPSVPSLDSPARKQGTRAVVLMNSQGLGFLMSKGR